MGDEGFVRFEVTEDDLESEFNPKRRKFTKNDAIYGVFNEESDESEDDRRGFGHAGRKGGKGKGLGAAPVSFVAGGSKKEDVSEESGTDASDRPRGGLGSRKGGASTQSRNRKKTEEVASWEKYTKGIGLKLLKKMGYKEGKGLGREQEGIAEPIEVKLRPQGMGLGFGDFEEITEQAKGRQREIELKEKKKKRREMGLPSEDEDEDMGDGERVGRAGAEGGRWKKSEKGPRQVFKSAAEVLKESDARIEIIDMTGKTPKVLSGYDQIGRGGEREGDDAGGRAFSSTVPELRHNINLLADLSLNDLTRLRKLERSEKESVTKLTNELQRLEGVRGVSAEKINRLEVFMAIIDKCEERIRPGAPNPLSMSDLCDVVLMLRDKYAPEYATYNVPSLAAAMAAVPISRELASWDPLVEPKRGLDVFLRWRRVLYPEVKEQRQKGEPEDAGVAAYDSLVWELWMPHVRRALSMARWSPREHPELATALLEAWLSVIPAWVAANVVEQIVMPALHAAVDAWNPRVDHVPIHSWLHPWLPLLGSRLESVHPVIRQKLGAALLEWHPSDPSAHAILAPWKGVFSEVEMDAFLARTVLPKLQGALYELVVDPRHQVLDQFRWVMDWGDMLSVERMGTLLANGFFPKWFAVLGGWLSSGAHVNYEEVTVWYLGWKSLFPEAVAQAPAVKQQFARALDMMNAAVAGGPPSQPPLPPSAPARQPPPPSQLPESARRIASQAAASLDGGASFVSTNFKDYVATLAQQNGVLFMPLAGKRHAGKALYLFGELVVYLDRAVVYVQDGDNWQPTSLDDLVTKAQQQ